MFKTKMNLIALLSLLFVMTACQIDKTILLE